MFEQFVQDHAEHPKAVLAYYQLGNFYFKEKEYKRAINYFDRVNTLRLTTEQQLETKFKLGYSYFSTKNFSKSLEYFDPIRRASNTYSSAASYYAGYVEYRNGDYDKALSSLKKAEQNPAYSSLVPYMIANIYYKQQRYDELLSYTESAY